VETEPRCPGCGGRLVEQDRTTSLRPVGALLLLAALALWVWAPRKLGELGYLCAAAGAVLGLALMPRRLRWRCVSCNAGFRRQPPPRMSPQGSGPEAADSESEDDSRQSCN
jgi:hypothetical protein